MMHGTAKCDRVHVQCSRLASGSVQYVVRVYSRFVVSTWGQHWTINCSGKGLSKAEVTVLSLRTNLQLVMLAVAIALELSCLG